MTHRIRRQILELELPREAGALDLQRRANRAFQEKVLPALDVVFGKIAPADRYVRIGRLEIELGDLDEARWEREFVEQCVSQIARHVAESALEAGSPDTPPSETLSPEENALNILLHFLDTGILPWFAKGISLRELETFLKKTVVEKPALLQNWLLPLLRRKPEALQRLVWQFSPDTAAIMLETALNLPEDWLVQAVRTRESQTARPVTAAERLWLYREILKPKSQAMLEQPPAPAVLAQLFAEQQTAPLPSPAKADFAQEQQEQRRPAEAPKPTAAPSDSPAPATYESVFVENAGLVLLAPYLPAFFSHLALAGEKDFENEEAQMRAAHLLHFLATGQEQPEEHLLFLSKILCGLPPETPVPQALDLTETEKTEAADLLEAVVRNWPALKNTGPDGLRQAFIRRNGQISWQESRQAWLLQIERLAQDILLDRLPWGYSVIKLPWMESILNTEW